MVDRLDIDVGSVPLKLFTGIISHISSVIQVTFFAASEMSILNVKMLEVMKLLEVGYLPS